MADTGSLTSFISAPKKEIVHVFRTAVSLFVGSNAKPLLRLLNLCQYLRRQAIVKDLVQQSCGPQFASECQH